MNDCRLADLLDLTILQKMADAHYQAAGMPIGIIDAIDGSILVGSGWQDICVKFHRANSVSRQRCLESDNYIKDRLVPGEACHYKCKNGLWDVGVAILVDGRHLATMFIGQFFYEDEAPDRDYFIKLAGEFGFDVDDYLAALDRVPVFSREKVAYILEYDKALLGFITDIAERELLKRKADEAIQEGERKFHAVFEQAYQFLGLLSIDGILLKANRTALEICGVAEAEVVGRHFWQTPWWAHSPELQAKVREAVQQAAKGQLIRFEASHITPEGNLRYVDFSLKPVKDEAGKVIMLMPEGQDITERKEAELERLTHLRFFQYMDQVNRAIQGADELLQMMSNVLKIVLSIFDCDRAWLFYPCDPDAPTFRVPMEITKPEYPGAKILNVDLPMSYDMAQNLREALATDDPLIYIAGTEKPINRMTAEQFGVQSQMFGVLYPRLGKPWVFGMHQCSYPRLWNQEEKRLFQEIGRRLSDALTSLTILADLKESEDKYRTLVHKIHAAVVVHNSDTQIVMCNPTAQKLLGLREDQLLGKTASDSIWHFFREDGTLMPFAEYPVNQVLARGKALRNLIVGVQHPNNKKEYEWLLINADPVFGEEGHITQVIVSFIDITERLSLESQLQQAQKLESVGRLAGGVAHDFNNMLGVILGHTELIMATADPSQPFFASLQEIRKAAERSAELTHQLLAFARKQTVTPKVLDLNETVAGMLRMLQRLIGEDIDLVWMPEEDLWPVEMDPSQFDQILANLCVNARDAIAGVGRVTIEMKNAAFAETYCADHPGFIPGDFVVLSVSDNGHGMDKETLGKIFEPFFTTKEIGRGTGLGLATVYGAVKQNSGFINVYSEPEQGTTFKICLPRHLPTSRQMPEKGPNAPVTRGNETILLVEDEAAILDMTRQMLETFGYRVLPASTPGEAIRMAREHAGQIHLLMTDVVMPEMNGRDLAKNIISLYPDIARLFMSGYTASVIAHHGVLDEGINFVQKPFSIQELAAKVRQALDG